MALVVFVGVEGALIWFLFRFKARRGRVAAQIHGNTRLEIGWTVGAAVILVFITVVTFIKLPGIKNPPASDIDASGAKVAATTLFASTDQPAPPEGARSSTSSSTASSTCGATSTRGWATRRSSPTRRWSCPVGMTVTLDITADDVAHSWWIPKLGGKMDAVPGYTNKTWFKADKPGVFEGQCAELCGRNHANMLARVRAVPFDEYQALVRPAGRRHQGRARRGRQAARGDPEAGAGGRTAVGIRVGKTPQTRMATTSEPPVTDTTAVRAKPRPQIIGARRQAPSRTGWPSWITTTDHKRIGILYLYTTLVFFILGGVEALLLRIQLGRAGEHVPLARRSTTRSSRCTGRR